MEIRTKIKNQEIKYNISNGFSLDENSFLANAIKQAYAVLYNTRIDLENEDDEKIKNFAQAIFESDDFSILRKNIEKIILKMRSGKIKFLKQKTFEGNEGSEKNVLASVEKGEDSLIKIYTSFFDTKNFKDDRAGVMIHELAHLCGLERESNIEGVDRNLRSKSVVGEAPRNAEAFQNGTSRSSAEALKNFCMLCAEKISLKEINSEKDKKENADDSNEDELTYSSDQPRAPKGESNGGQWVSQDGGGSGGSNSKKSDKKNKEAESKETDKNTKEKTPAESKKTENTNNSEKVPSIKIPEGKAPEGALSPDTRFEANDKENGSNGKSIEMEEAFNFSEKDGKKEYWGALSLYDEGYEPNSDVTVLVNLNIKTIDKDGIANKDDITVAYDSKADENGNIKVDRIGIIDNTYGNKPSLDKYDSIEIDMDISTLQGRPKDYFDMANPEMNFDLGVREYAAAHAQASNRENFASRDGAQGGRVSLYEKRKEEKYIFSGSVGINFSEGKTKRIERKKVEE